MPRAIDHLVIPAHDLEAQAALYRRLGFQVGARNRHPWGTENRIIQLEGSFLELIGLGEGFVAPAPGAPVSPFAGFLAGFLRAREGLAMLVMRSHDAETDRRAFAADGLGDFPRFDFARKGRRPDGGETEVAFSLAFARSAAMPEAGFFVCQQHFPENFWSAAAQVHPNGARRVAGVAFALDDPSSTEAFLCGFVGAPARAVAGGFVVAAAGSEVECLTPQGFSARYGAAALAPGGGPLALLRIAVDDLSDLRRRLAAAGVDYAWFGGRAIVSPTAAFGAAFAFEAAK